MAQVIAFNGIRPLKKFNEDQIVSLDQVTLQSVKNCIQTGRLTKDDKPSFYAYKHTYVAEHGERNLTGLIGLVAIGAEFENNIKIHENIIDSRVAGLKNYFTESQIQKDIALCFYKDDRGIEKKMLETALNKPVNIFKTDNSSYTIARINKKEDVAFLKLFFQNKTLYLADGHHRYQALLELEVENKKASFLLTLLVNTTFTNLEVLPYQRLYKGEINKEIFLNRIKEDFFIEPSAETPLPPVLRNHYNLILDKKFFKLSLKPGKAEQIPWRFPDFIKNLDLTIVHYYFFEKYLGIKGWDQRNSKNIKYCSIFMYCLREIEMGKANLAILTKEITFDEIIQVADSGYLYPQKTTYFYPKAISGLLFAEVI